MENLSLLTPEMNLTRKQRTKGEVKVRGKKGIRRLLQEREVCTGLYLSWQLTWQVQHVFFSNLLQKTIADMACADNLGALLRPFMGCHVMVKPLFFLSFVP
ncbi:hypothetical protein COLO4_24787 [Corchorus olitorius]|uniref:Uncharacterized protein n=1 Tax=Corchorus olitorius TaxID=93759 RepID=A0A1R3I6Y4_9ROSI|nr:hypothetical protein COLO4_24787 [Corchorus olitorius]